MICNPMRDNGKEIGLRPHFFFPFLLLKKSHGIPATYRRPEGVDLSLFIDLTGGGWI